MKNLCLLLLMMLPLALGAQNIDDNIAERLDPMGLPIVPPLAIDFLDFPLTVIQMRDESDPDNWINANRTESVLNEEGDNVRIAIANWENQWIYDVEADMEYGYGSADIVNTFTLEINGTEVEEFAPVIQEAEFSHDGNGNIVEAEYDISLNQGGIPLQLIGLVEQVYNNNQLQIRLNYAPGLAFFPLEFSDRISYSWDGNDVEESELETYNPDTGDFEPTELKEYTYSGGIMESYVRSEYDAEDGFYKPRFSRGYEYIEGGKIGILTEFELSDTSLFGDRYNYDYNEDLIMQQIVVETTEDGANWVNDSRQDLIYENGELQEIQIFIWDGFAWPDLHSGRVLFSEPEVISPPIPPANLTATIDGANPLVVDLAWIDNASDETTYLVERSTDGTNFGEINSLPENATNTSDENVASETTYFYRVAAINSGGISNYSNVAEITTAAVPPSAPINLTAIALVTWTYRIELNWIDSSEGEDGFVLERKFGDGEWLELTTLAANEVTYIDEDPGASWDLNPDVFYRVYSFNENGNSEYSNVADILVFLNGLAEEENSYWNIYPNPAIGFVNFDFTEINTEKSIQFFDLMGRKVKEKIIPTGIDFVQFSIDEIPTGTYHVIVSEGDKKSSRSILIN